MQTIEIHQEIWNPIRTRIDYFSERVSNYDWPVSRIQDNDHFYYVKEIF